jgi:3-oxoacyl-[acyl-carrier-protein] synthase-3
MPEMLYPIRIAGSGAYRPAGKLASAEIDARRGMPEGHTEARSGVRVRSVAGDETSSDMAVSAALMALEEACLDAGDLDLIVSACAIPERLIPSMAPLIQRKLGLSSHRVAAYDMNATCLSFVAAMEHAGGMILAGRAANVLIVCSEIPSRGLPWEAQPDTASLFGDGAAAVVVRRAPEGVGILAADFQSFPEAYEACTIGAGGTRIDFHDRREAFEAETRFHMDVMSVYRLGMRVAKPFADGLLAKAGWTLADVEVVVPHQASRSGLDHVPRLIGFDPAKVVDILADHGNQVAASLPTALHHARRDGRIKPGTKVFLMGTAAGISVGGLAFVA